MLLEKFKIKPFIFIFLFFRSVYLPSNRNIVQQNLTYPFVYQFYDKWINSQQPPFFFANGIDPTCVISRSPTTFERTSASRGRVDVLRNPRRFFQGVSGSSSSSSFFSTSIQGRSDGWRVQGVGYSGEQRGYDRSDCRLSGVAGAGASEQQSSRREWREWHMAELTAPSPPPTSLPPVGHRSTTPLVRMSLAWDNPSRISPAWIALLEFPSCVTEEEEEEDSRKDYAETRITGRNKFSEISRDRWSKLMGFDDRRRREGKWIHDYRMLIQWFGEEFVGILVVLEKFVSL